MFANFAARRHLTGPLRAVSPVAEFDSEIDWKTASKRAKKASPKKSMPEPSANSLKLAKYFEKSFQGSLPVEKVGAKESLQLVFVEAVSLLIPMLYITLVFAVLTGAIIAFSQPVFLFLTSEQYIEATLWASPAVLAFGLLYILLRPLFGGFKSYPRTF